jgi:hypothetical protein
MGISFGELNKVVILTPTTRTRPSRSTLSNSQTGTSRLMYFTTRRCPSWTPLTRLALSDYDCTLGKSASDENTTIANHVNLVTLTVHGKVITGWYGWRRYYSDYVLQGCGDDPSLRPTWVLHKDMYQSKEYCCYKNFQWIGLVRCLGEKFLEANFLTVPPTSFPSMGPSMTPSVMPSEMPSKMPSEMLSKFASEMSSYLPPPSHPCRFGYLPVAVFVFDTRRG